MAAPGARPQALSLDAAADGGSFSAAGRAPPPSGTERVELRPLPSPSPAAAPAAASAAAEAAPAAAAAAAAARASGVFLRAGAQCHAGDVAFTEAPTAATAAAARRFTVPSCAHCLRPLPGPLALHARAQTAAHADEADGGGGAPLPELPPLLDAPQAEEEQDVCCACPLGCEDAFCGARCRDAACGADGWHALLCCAGLDEAHPLRLFDAHARDTSDLFLLCGRVLAGALVQARAAGGTPEAAAAAMERLQVRAPCPAQRCAARSRIARARRRQLPAASARRLEAVHAHVYHLRPLTPARVPWLRVLSLPPLRAAGAAAASAGHVVGLHPRARALARRGAG
jgi:hypothetical protein